MLALGPIVLYCWPIVTILLFLNLRPAKAVVVSVIGGYLFLPMTTIDVPLIGSLTKTTSVAIGLMIGSLLSGSDDGIRVRVRSFDIPMLLWCLASPFFSSVVNGLGAYDGFSGSVQATLNWGVFYYIGKKYFSEASRLRILSGSILIGGLLYIPLILFELRMSPQLSRMVYGFFPHSFAQHIRYGGYRPIVFMQHGLAVSFWMAAAAAVCFWFWRTRQKKSVMGIPVAIAALSLIAVTILCKSANAWAYIALSVAGFFYFRRKRRTKLFSLVLLIIPIYVAFRISGVVSTKELADSLGKIFDSERIVSLTSRLTQEDLFSQRAMMRPIFGWGNMTRAWPMAARSGFAVPQAIDALWLIQFSTKGIFGLACLFLSLGLGPLRILRRVKTLPSPGPGGIDDFQVDAVVLSLIVILFLVDSLLNAMISPVWILCAGALAGNSETRPKVEDSEGRQA